MEKAPKRHRLALSILWRVLVVLPGVAATVYGWRAALSAHGPPGVVAAGLVFYGGLIYLGIVGLVFLIFFIGSRSRKRRVFR